MTISPVTFATASPVAPIERVGRLHRRPKSTRHREATEASRAEPISAAQSATELVSNEARDALIYLRLGG